MNPMSSSLASEWLTVLISMPPSNAAISDTVYLFVVDSIETILTRVESDIALKIFVMASMSSSLSIANTWSLGFEETIIFQSIYS